MDWNMPTQFSPTQNIQLEEYYLSAQGQGRPHPTPLTHTASYPPTAQSQYRSYHNVPHNPAGRSHSLGQNGANGNIYDSNTLGVYNTSMSQTQPSTYSQNPNSTTGLYASPSLPYHQYQPKAQIVTSPASTGAGSSGPLSINGTSDGGLTPPFVSSPMSAPLGFGSQEPPQGQAQGQTHYHPEMRPQQIFNFQLPGTSESIISPEGLAHSHELAHQPKRPRGDEDEDYGPGIDVGMDHEGNAGYDNKDSKPKP